MLHFFNTAHSKANSLHIQQLVLLAEFYIFATGWAVLQFNLDSFLSNIRTFLSKIPSGRPPKSVADDIAPKCRVLYFPLVFPHYELPRRCKARPTEAVTDNFKCEDLQRPLHIVWPHRWEHDKNPGFFVTVLEELHAEDLPFRLSILGQQFSEIPG